MHEVHTVVVGAGQAGLAVSYLLARAGVGHVVYERGRIGESWRGQRWDTFALNTPNWSNRLPGDLTPDWDADGFGLRDDLVSFFQDYVSHNSIPVREGTPVTSIARNGDGRFAVESTDGAVHAANVVVCSGSMSEPRLPAMAHDVDGSLLTLSAGTYKRADQLPAGAVVVVGSGQSGCQIAEDLLSAGRSVYVCASRVARVPRRYRGRDIIDWLTDSGFMDQRVEDLDDPAMQYATQPQVSGSDGGHTVSLQSLARDGATLLGRVAEVDGTTLRLVPNLHDCVEFADQMSEFFKSMVDDHIDGSGLDAPPPEPDPYEPAMPDLRGSDELTELDLTEHGVSTIIWCTGFTGDFSWLGEDILDDRGVPRHERGVSEIAGLYFVGFPWISKRKSGILLGVAEDAEHVVNHLVARST